MNGKTTKSKVKAATSIQTVKNTTANGPEIKNQAMEPISTKMETYI